MKRFLLVAMVWAPLVAVGLVELGVSGCSAPPTTSLPPDGGTAPVLAILTPPGPQLGLHYGATVKLRVSYRRASGSSAAVPVAGQPVQFRFFGDPAGSTLSAAQVLSDDSGVATVSLTAGSAEAEFRVVASAVNAADVTFSVGVSQLEFVTLAVTLSDPTPSPSASPSPGSPATTLQVRLYEGTSCAQVGVQVPPEDALQALSAPGPSATQMLINLTARAYTIEGRSSDSATGELLAHGCIDLPTGLLSPGDDFAVTVPLIPVSPSLVGTYQLHTTLASPPPSPPPPSAAWHALSDCSNGFAQQLLDGMVAQLNSTAQATLATERGTLDENGCRKSTTGAGLPSLDASLTVLLTPANAPLLLLPALVDDLDALTYHLQLDSVFTVTSGGTLLIGEHALTRLTLGPTGGTQAATDLTNSALPVVDVKDIALGYDGHQLTIAPHGFTLHLGHWWRQGFFSVAVLPRFAALPASTLSSAPVLQLFAGAASKGGLTGCAAIESLVCTGVPAKGDCTGSAAPACSATLVTLGVALDQSFGPGSLFGSPWPTPAPTPFPSPSPGESPVPLPTIDFIVAGSASAVDADYDLQVDQLTGLFDTSIGPANFVGSRVQ